MRTQVDTGVRSVKRIPAAGFGLVVVLWAVFGAILVLEPSRFDTLWAAFRDWPVLGQVAGWILLLPWVLATLVWGTGWALWARLLLIGLIALFTLVAFSPKPPQRMNVVATAKQAAE